MPALPADQDVPIDRAIGLAGRKVLENEFGKNGGVTYSCIAQLWKSNI